MPAIGKKAVALNGIFSGTEVNVFAEYKAYLARVLADNGVTLLGSDGTTIYLRDQIEALKDISNWTEYITKVQTDSGTLLLGSDGTLIYFTTQINTLI